MSLFLNSFSGHKNEAAWWGAKWANRKIKKLLIPGEAKGTVHQFPPLRQRKRDIANLVRAFLQKYNDKYCSKKRILPEVIRYFETSYDWPGNVRELENVVERLVVTSRCDVIKLGDEVLNDYFDHRVTRKVA